ncbi:lipopolysaccharide biosynthesis protein [Bacteroides acidifaciens]|uniref:lipopolysaccharide biosynthesis protein n=1 Tax=Bacteroides acidifaciens TaxID=85831 RepID=UPI0025974420|nr:lipopolysaccharide biosynthesis protein [uncultured Bacteroides sp.]
MNDNTSINRRIAKNTLLLYLRMILLIAVGLYTSRVVLKTLGISDYGIYNVVGGFISMIAYMNTVFVAATQRFLSYSLGQNDELHLKRVFCTSLTVHIFLAFVILLLAETFGLWIINTKLIIEPSRLVAANWVYHCSILSLLFTIIGVPYNACIVAHEHMNVYAYISIFDAVAKLIIVYVLCFVDCDKLILYSLLLVCVSIIDVLLFQVYCRKKFEECHFIFLLDGKMIKKMTSYAGWTAIGTLGFTFKDQAFNIILNLFFGTVVNAARGVAVQVNGIINQFASNFFMAVSPQITKQYASGSIDRSISLVYASAKFAFFLLSIIIIPFSINMNYILEIWLDIVPNYTNEFLQIILISTLIGSLSTSTTTAIQATGNIRNFQIGISIIFLCELPIAYLLLLNGYNPYYAAVPSIVTQFIGILFRFYILNKQVKGYNFKYFMVSVVFRSLMVIGICFMLMHYIAAFMKPCLVTLISTSVVSTIFTFLMIFFLGFNVRERQIAKTYIEKIVKRKRLS